MLDTTLALVTGLLAVAFATALVGAALGGAWMLGRGWRRDRSVNESSTEDLASQKMTEMMARIEELTLELERSSEGQRYLAKMLAGGARIEPGVGAADPMRAQERVVTPH
jgi:hypothetical protein